MGICVQKIIRLPIVHLSRSLSRLPDRMLLLISAQNIIMDMFNFVSEAKDTLPILISN